MWQILLFIAIILFLFLKMRENYTPLFRAHLYPYTTSDIKKYEQMSRLPFFPPVGPYTLGWEASLQNKIEYPSQSRIYNYLYPS